MQIRFNTTMGTIDIELYEEQAPTSSDNFLRYAQEGFFDNTIFHRVIPGFVIQGGGFTPEMQQKTTHAPIQNESNNGLKNLRGTLSMARTNDPHSATSQFFINLSDNDFLNFKNESPQGWGYAVFGEVVAGMDVVDQIAKVKTGSKKGHQDVPVETIVVESAEVIGE